MILVDQIEANNVFRMRQLGQHYSASNLASKGNLFVARNFAESTSTVEFLSLAKDKVLSLLSRSDIEVNLKNMFLSHVNAG